MNTQIEIAPKIINGLQVKDVILLYNYLSMYEISVKEFSGKFDIDDKKVKTFLDRYDIYLTTMAKKNLSKANKHKLYVRFEQKKNSKASGSDIAHHLLRHIRNSIAHVRIEKQAGDIYVLTDNNGKVDTMETKLPEKVLKGLIEVLLKSKHK